MNFVEEFVKALECREAMERGIYCECDEPDLSGGLMCRKCWYRNKDAEREACARICEPHQFVPDSEFDGIICSICTMQESALRHHGIAAIPHYSWER